MANLGNTERTLRHLAKELACQFYEAKRSDAFRSNDALVTAFTLQKGEDGVVREVRVKVPFTMAYPDARIYAKAHWPHFYQAARQCAVGLLKQPDARISETLKKRIFNALKEDRYRQLVYGGAELLQVKMENIDGQAQK